MSVRIFIFLPLSLFLTLNADAELNVTPCLQSSLNDDDSVTVICQYDGDISWTMGAQLFREDEKICETSEKPACAWSKKGNQFEFTLKNLTLDQKKQLYKCSVYRRSPLPITYEYGKQIKLYPGCSCPAHNVSCDSVDHGNACPSAGFLNLNLPGLLTWALIALVLLLCLYSLSVTILYIKLRVRWSEELHDTLTYVPMQVKPKKKVRRHEADKNTEYMDMREVHPQAGLIRDLNHNSHQIPAGFIMQSNIPFNRMGM